MKKNLSFSLAALAFFCFLRLLRYLLLLLTSHNITENPAISEKSYTFIDENLIGTKIDGPTTRTGGYLYKNISYTKTNDTKKYLGIVTKGTSVSFGVTLKSYINLGVASSVSRQYKEYRHTADFKATWGVNDKYSGNYMYSTTTTHKGVTYYSYTRA